ncbi:hypothetical protein GPA22_04610 [Aromatoleum toluvorans]|uniref:Uncharacterized protein n=1 Tax=Aromatoleum toluvorans TaxID=92002 RepID=A0ABX1PY16_9RHOO|nr:hypothetical protein [Aromatoleum toluvorans]NMG43011.1 hypothetical protein [Aromatoleum toluvorans]
MLEAPVRLGLEARDLRFPKANLPVILLRIVPSGCDGRGVPCPAFLGTGAIVDDIASRIGVNEFQTKSLKVRKSAGVEK